MLSAAVVIGALRVNASTGKCIRNVQLSRNDVLEPSLASSRSMIFIFFYFSMIYVFL